MASAVVKSVPKLSPPLVAIPGPCTIFLDKEEIIIPATAYTLPGFRVWVRSDAFPERGHVAFIGGEIFIDMSGEELQAHNWLKAEISRGIMNLIVDQDLGRFFADRARVSNDEADLSNDPDAAFASWETLKSGRVRLVAHEERQERLLEAEGTPDWVMEIVSDSSVRKDTRLLRERYHRAGIPEYWLIDARGEDVDFQILLHRPEGYVRAPHKGKWQRSQVFGRQFRLTRKRDPIGCWFYTLQMKPL